MAPTPSDGTPERAVSLHRRGLLGAVGGAISIGVAGCLGDSTDEIEASLEASMEHLEEAGESFDELGAHMDREDWESCLDSVDPVREDLAAAEAEASDARSLAEEEDHPEFAEVATAALALIDVGFSMTDELEEVCIAASEEDFDRVEEHLENVEELEELRVEREEAFEEALESI